MSALPHAVRGVVSVSLSAAHLQQCARGLVGELEARARDVQGDGAGCCGGDGSWARREGGEDAEGSGGLLGLVSFLDVCGCSCGFGRDVP